MQAIKKHKLFLLLLFIGAFLRFYNLNWGAPFYFHPDERNIVGLILSTSLSNPTSLLNGTFAYGNFPVILTLLLKPLFLPFSQIFKATDPFAQVVITLRIISAAFSVLTLYVIYLCGKFWSERIALLGLFLATFSAGLIQQAHFGTYDGFVAFCAVTVFYFLLRFIKTKKSLFYYLSFLFIAVGSAAKVNLLVLAVFPLFILLSKLKKGETHLDVIKHAVLGLILLLGLTIALSPNYLTSEFRNSLLYERGLVTGTTPVFYTQSFYDTTPIVFQLLHIFPFLINPIMTIIFIPAFFYLLLQGFKTKNASFLILNSYFLILFIPQALLFAKWTRYMVPTLPFIYLIISIAAINFLQYFRRVSGIKYLVLSILALSGIIFSLSYFITTFVRQDTRIEAANYTKKNIPTNTNILTESYDLGLMPFNSVSPNIAIFNFYGLDNNLSESTPETLNNILQKSDYVILPSQRLLRSRLLNAKKFPKGNGIYSLLINEALGYQNNYQTPCDIFCKITYLGDPVFSFEETASVFDRPTVFIFKKISK